MLKAQKGNGLMLQHQTEIESHLSNQELSQVRVTNVLIEHIEKNTHIQDSSYFS